MTAGYVVGNHDPIAVAEIADIDADCGHLTDQLMAEYRARLHGAVVELEQICPAQADDAHLEQQLARPGRRQRAFLQPCAIATAAGNDPMASGNGHELVPGNAIRRWRPW